MIAYFYSMINYGLLDVVQVSTYTVCTKSGFDGRSKIILARKPNIPSNQGDRLPWVMLKEDNTTIYQGIVSSVDDNLTNISVVINQCETVFDTRVVLSGESEISATGIEDFIKSVIEDTFTATGDTLDLNYITVIADTHTKSAEIPENSNGIYNLNTYLSKVLTDYNIRLIWTFGDGITIHVVRDTSVLKFDTKISDVTNYNETINTDILAKLNVRWQGESETVNKTYYYLSDGTLSEVSTSANRVIGKTSALFIRADTEEEVEERALVEFSKNKYDHAINIEFNAQSKLYPKSEFYIGRKAEVATKKGKIYESVISTVSSSDDKIMTVKFGLRAVTLIEKIKGGLS